MLYLVYILIGMLIVLGVNLLITAFWALHDMYVKKENADKLRKQLADFSKQTPKDVTIKIAY